MKQSSIEWLFDELVNRTDKYFFLEELQQSKEMHEREITKAYHEGQLMVLKIIKENLPNFISTSDENDLSDANEYYKNTYEKE